MKEKTILNILFIAAAVYLLTMSILFSIDFKANPGKYTLNTTTSNSLATFSYLGQDVMLKSQCEPYKLFYNNINTFFLKPLYWFLIMFALVRLTFFIKKNTKDDPPETNQQKTPFS